MIELYGFVVQCFDAFFRLVLLGVVICALCGIAWAIIDIFAPRPPSTRKLSDLQRRNDE